MSVYANTVRMLHSGVVLRDSVRGSDLRAAHARHDQLVHDMASVVCGTCTRVQDGGVRRSTIFVGDRALIEVSTT